MHGAALALRTVLAIAYPVLAHAANARGDGVLAAIALADLAGVVLAGHLLRGDARAWGAMLALAPALAWLATTPHATLPLLAPPVVFLALAGWMFARTLRTGRVPLLTRVAAALHAMPPAALEPALARYTARLTGAWAALLFALCLVNLVLAVCAVPEGLLARLGQPSPLPIGGARGSLFANLLIHGVVGAGLLLEFLWRRHRFPAEPYGGAWGFVRRLASLGPVAWRDILR